MGNLPDYLHRIPRELPVSGNDGQAFNLCLGNQETVEWIFVNGWRGWAAKHVRRLNRKRGQTVPLHLTLQESCRPALQMQFSCPRLQHHLPHVRGAQKQLVGSVLNEVTRRFGEAPVIRHHPKECMGIEDRVHR